MHTDTAVETMLPTVNYTYRAQLVHTSHVIDGDTIRLLVDNGFYNREFHAFRLLNVNTPEIFTKDAEERALGYIAKGEVHNWLDGSLACADGAEWPLIIVTEKDKQTFNRYIAEVYCNGCGDSLNQYLIKKGYT